MTEHTRWWAEMLGHWGLAWAVVVVLVAGWFLMLRPRRAALRYGGWLLATFAGLTLLPIVSGLAPRLDWRDALAQLRIAPDRARSAGQPAPFRSWFENMGGASVPRPLLGEEPGGLLPPSTVSGARAASSAPARTIDEVRPFDDRWLMTALTLWLVGAVFMLLRLARTAGQAFTMVGASSRPAADGLEEEAETIRRGFGIRRRVRLLIHPEIEAPLCIGLVRPVILWPTSENCPMTPGQRRAALVHEVAHLRHLDDWIALAAEVWRGLAWFFLPVHWTVARARLERECRCDDLAAGEMQDPHTYARWLLDLAPVRVVSPLAASLSGGSNLAQRVRRIIRGELRWARPLGRPKLTALACLALLLLGAASSVRLVGILRADEQADAPLPDITPNELATRLRAASAGSDKGLLEIAFETTENTNWRFPSNAGTAAEQEPIVVQYPGRVRFLGDGKRWRVEYDGMSATSLSKDLGPDRWSSGFDGQQFHGWDVMRNIVTLGETERPAENWTPRELFWHRGESLAHALEKPLGEGNTLTISQRTVDGTRCYVIERTFAEQGSRSEEIVSPRQGYLVLRTTWFRKGKPYHTQSLHDVREVKPGIWAPGRIFEESKAVRDDGAEQLRRRTESRIVTFEPDKTFNEDAFAFEPPYGVDVTDRRLGYSYHNDPWWPEAGKLLREQFDWPSVDLSPLRSLGSPAKFDAQTAPPISSVAWINSEPLELAKLLGKVVLVEFWGMADPETIPALRTLYETYHPAGLEIVSVHTPTQEVEKVRRFAQEYRIPYPIAIDTEAERGGVTSQAYGVLGYPCAFLLDHEGGVHTVGEATAEGSTLMATLITLLEKAGAKDVRAISLKDAELTKEMITAVREALPKWLEGAPAEGVIRGRVVEGQAQPIAGAKVTGAVKLTLLNFAQPGSYRPISPSRRFDAACGPDGRFELHGLTKGTYSMKVEAPGRAWQELEVAIGPDLEPKDVVVSLDQGDTISGLVRDPDGRPIAEALVTPTGRQYTTPNGAEWIDQSPRVKPAETNAEGRYGLPGLRHGKYSLNVKAPGFQEHDLEAVPAGTMDADVILERSESQAAAHP